MSSRTKKRPSSARRNIHIETFSPFVSGARLRQIQNQLYTTSTDNADAVLCISGIDSRYNEGTTELINYLLFGFFELRKAELEKSGFEEEIIDDIIILIKRNEVHVYCNPINYHYLLPYISHWRNIRFHCMTDTEFEDEEAAEEFKIQSFIAMVTGCEKIGIPYFTRGNQQDFDKMMVEKWPIVQAYALDEYSGRGFFTMRHEVVDVSTSVHNIYNEMDPSSLELLITERLWMFEKQWKTMLVTADMEMMNNSMVLREEKVCEVLRSFYKHGKVGTEHSSDKQTRPFVLFGTNTKKSVLESVKSGETTINTEIMKCGVDGDVPKFMVCHGVSPNGPISCSRTYFFTGFSDPLSDKTSGPSEDEETRVLVQVYSVMVDAVLHAIQVYVKTLSCHMARAAAVDMVCEECNKLGSPMIQKYLQRRSNIIFTLEAYDSLGQPSPIPDGEKVLRVKTAGISLVDIPSYKNPAKILGSLVFSDVFIDSVLQIQKKDGTITRDFEVLYLTGQIPRYQAWAIRNKGRDEVTILEENFKNMKDESYGSVLISGESVHIGSYRNICQPPVEANLYIYQNRIVLICPQTGAIVLDNSIIKSLQFFDDDNSRSVAILVIEVKITMKSALPSYLVSSNNLIFISFNPKSKAYKQMYSQVLPEWKKESELPEVVKIHELPDCFTQIHGLLQILYSNTTKTVTDFRRAAGSLDNIDRFLYHFSAGSVGTIPFEEEYVPLIVNRKEEESESNGTFEVLSSDSDKIIINIIGGIDGSHKENLCNTLVNLTKGRQSWTVLQQDRTQSTCFIPHQLHKSLKNLYIASHRSRSTFTDSKQPSRVLLVTPGCMDLHDVIQCISNHPDVQIRQKISIGAVTVCIDPMHSFMQHKMTFPVLLSQCAQGWVNHILFTSSTSINNTVLDDIQKMIRSANSDVSFFLADKGEITRSMDIDAVLSETAFHDSSKVRSRHLLYPGWSLGLYKSYPPSVVLQSTLLKFQRPIERQSIVNKLRELKTKLKYYPFDGNIYFVDGKVQFGDSTQAVDVTYTTVSDSLSMVSNGSGVPNGDGPHSYFISFTGCNLQEKVLKDWLRSCAKQVPQKKKMIEKKDLKRDEIKKIHSQHHLDPLPAGWFYNGTQYVSFDGEKQDQHPCLDDFVKQYIIDKNKEVEKFNAKVDMEARMFVDLFS